MAKMAKMAKMSKIAKIANMAKIAKIANISNMANMAMIKFHISYVYILYNHRHILIVKVNPLCNWVLGRIRHIFLCNLVLEIRLRILLCSRLLGKVIRSLLCSCEIIEKIFVKKIFTFWKISRQSRMSRDIFFHERCFLSEMCHSVKSVKKFSWKKNSHFLEEKRYFRPGF